MFKAAGLTIDLYREQIINDGGATYGAGITDDYRFNSTVSATPARLTHVPVAPYVSNVPFSDNWPEHDKGKVGQTKDPFAIYQR